jgi:PAS domain S-box-containing protein
MSTGGSPDEVARLRATVARLEAELARARDAKLMSDTILQTIPAIVLRVSLDLKIEFISRVLPEYQGAPLIGQPVFAFAPADQHAAIRESLEAALASRQPTTYETIARAPDGTTDWYFTTVGPIIDHGVLTGLTLVCTNVSRVKRAEAELSSSRAQLEVALDAGGVGIWRWDAIRDVVEWDDRLCRMFGLTQKNAPRTRAEFLALVPVEHQGRMGAHIDAAVQTGHYPDFDLPAGTPSAPRWFIIKGGTVRDALGAVTGLLGGVLDVTGLRTLEEQVRQTQKLEAVGQLSAGVAHNFNNMLATIVPTLELAKARLEGSDRALAESALQSALQASGLVKELLAFSHRGAPNRGTTEPLGVVVRRAATLCEGTFEQRVRVELGDLDAAEGVDVDGAHTEQALVNLLMNARDAVEELAADRRTIFVRARRLSGSEVAAVHAEARGEYVELQVEDRGRGMKAGIRRRIFEPFFTTKAHGKGTGLGLSTAWAAAKAQHGFLDCESTEGAGTIFRLLLPRSAAPGGPGQASLTPPQASPGAVVLVIDDQPNVLASTVKLLELMGFRAIGASSGEEGVRLAKSQNVNVVLLDYSMPGQPPQTTLAQLREIDADLPVISFSGLGRPLEGATLSLPKPATGEQLEQALAQALDPRAREKQRPA